MATMDQSLPATMGRCYDVGEDHFFGFLSAGAVGSGPRFFIGELVGV
jgi:hypothetical protein